MLFKTFKLRDLEIPQIGLGTHSLRGTLCSQTVNFALSLGYKHIDTSPSYHNEHMIANSLSRVPRESFFISTKISYSHHGFSKASESILRSLSLLNVSYLDMCMIEWPGVKNQENFSSYNSIKRLETWEVLEDFKSQGKIKHIGVANFKTKHLEGLISSAKVLPEVNQIEVHPLCFDAELIEFCQKQLIQVIAHSPLAKKSSILWNDLELIMIAKRYKVTVPQIILNWTVSKGIAVIPRSQNYDHIRSNSMLDFVLDENEVKYLDSLNKNLYTSKDTTHIL